MICTLEQHFWPSSWPAEYDQHLDNGMDFCERVPIYLNLVHDSKNNWPVKYVRSILPSFIFYQVLQNIPNWAWTFGSMRLKTKILTFVWSAPQKSIDNCWENMGPKRARWESFVSLETCIERNRKNLALFVKFWNHSDDNVREIGSLEKG